MKLKQYVVDAFADRVFTGNPAAVCVTEAELSEAAMLAVARENNLSETAFARRLGQSYGLRWFTPGGEIDLCGHATLATAFVITNYYDPAAQTADFDTMSGRLSVKRSSGLYEMDFPAYELRRTDVTDEMERALGTRPLEAYIGRDLLCVLPGEAEVRQLKPDLELVSGLDGLLVHVTARGSAYDCVSRSFAPKLCVDEDPVCGSGHCHIAPYWAERLGKPELRAYQASRRGGELFCRVSGQRVSLAGNAVLYSESIIRVPDDLL